MLEFDRSVAEQFPPASRRGRAHRPCRFGRSPRDRRRWRSACRRRRFSSLTCLSNTLSNSTVAPTLTPFASLALDLRQCLGGRARARVRSRPESPRQPASRSITGAGRRADWRAPSEVRGRGQRRAELDQHVVLEHGGRARGTSRACASLSRQAASSISTARSRGLPRLTLVAFPCAPRDAARKSKAKSASSSRRRARIGARKPPPASIALYKCPRR